MAASNAKSKKPKEEEKKTQTLKEKQKTPTKKKVDVKKSSGSNSTAKATKTAKTPEKKTTANGKTPSKQTPRRDNEPKKKKRKAVANGKVSETDDAEGLLSSFESEEVANGGNVKNQKGKSPKTEKRKREEEEEEEDESGDDGEEKGEEKMCRFPMNRIKRIIKIENFDVGITQEAIFLVNKATEKFLEKVADDGYKCCIKDKKKSLSYNHLSSVVSKQRRYQFLSDFVPVKIKAENALKELKLTEVS